MYDVRPDGSCFYRSVYHVLLHYGYLYQFCSYIFGQEISNEDVFVAQIRKHISKRIALGKDFNHIHQVYDKLSSDDDSTFMLIQEGLPTWFQRSVPQKPTNEQRFRSIVSKAILLTNSWASEIDIPIFMSLFRRCFGESLRLSIVNFREDTRTGLPPNFKMQKGNVYIVNLDEVHYNYLVHKNINTCAGNKVRNPSTRRCIKVDGRVGKRLLHMNARMSPLE